MSWQRVAEDYAPFDVDVTTQDPGDDAIFRASSSDLLYGTRAVISPTNFTGSNIGGIAYVGVTNSIQKPKVYNQKKLIIIEKSKLDWC